MITTKFRQNRHCWHERRRRRCVYPRTRQNQKIRQQWPSRTSWPDALAPNTGTPRILKSLWANSCPSEKPLGLWPSACFGPACQLKRPCMQIGRRFGRMRQPSTAWTRSPSRPSWSGPIRKRRSFTYTGWWTLPWCVSGRICPTVPLLWPTPCILRRDERQGDIVAPGPGHDWVSHDTVSTCILNVSKSCWIIMNYSKLCWIIPSGSKANRFGFVCRLPGATLAPMRNRRRWTRCVRPWVCATSRNCTTPSGICADGTGPIRLSPMEPRPLISCRLMIRKQGLLY